MDVFDLPKLEEKVLATWKAKKIFEQSLKLRQAKRDKQKGKTFVFYEGPPYANGKPGIHHVLARVVKDIILRYKSMAGFYVPRRAGWDTHGLPVEIAAEKALGLASKKDIERVGIKAFNEKAKENVWLYKAEWEHLTERIGYWLDLKNAYITYESEYIESVWWSLKRISERKLLYKGHKVVPWCVRCGTTLSSHELAQGYKETTDTSVYVKFRIMDLESRVKIGDGGNVYMLSWTTTPWTLPGNVALAVGENIEYSAVRVGGADEIFIVASERVSSVFKDASGGVDIVKTIEGADLVGLEYEPLFNISSLKNDKAHKIYAADFVATGEGTGVVHTAVMYGEDDYALGVKVGLPQAHTVTEEGFFGNDVPHGLAGMPIVRGDQKDLDTEKKILEILKKNGNVFRSETYPHEYPFCWRCNTPVLYYARNSWFIAMSKLRNELLKNNQKIQWIPGNVKNGRFGEWLREVKDWNLSRERFWGAPLPIWECDACGAHEVVGSLDELSARAGGAKNRYWVMRHGESESNVKNLIDSGQNHFCLTERGKKQIDRSIKKLIRDLKKSKLKIDLIIASGITRTKETAERMAGALGVPNVSFDDRIQEIYLGSLSGCHDKKYRELFPTYESRFALRPEGGGESLRDLRSRIAAFFKDVEQTYSGRNILIVSHEYPIWMMSSVALGWSEAHAIREKEGRGGDFAGFAEVEQVEYKIIPRNDTGEVDLHRPYADEISFLCHGCGSPMRRVKEVADVWYDSGAMPFAQGHWPFTQNQKSKIKNQKLPEEFPADFISEGMDQTRGWFYTLLAIATALGYKAPYKNVISLGLINDKHGQKMSKSKGNIVDPWDVIRKHGADAVRWYFYTANPPGEPKNFDEMEIAKTFRRFHLIIWNSLKFLETYKSGSRVINYEIESRAAKHKSGEKDIEHSHILDQWIMARLREAVALVTEKLEGYEIREAALEIERFVDDLSRWYIRRSRRRFQPDRNMGGSREDSRKADHLAASATLGHVLRELSKLLAPFTPFFAELIYERLGGRGSVHLENWPTVKSKIKNQKSKILIKHMQEIRRLAALGLAARAEAKIKVRQPLSRLRVKCHVSNTKKELFEILADEVNVKEVIFDPVINSLAGEEVELDIEITQDLRDEGMVREFARMIQDLRQEAGLRPKDTIALMIEASEELIASLRKNESAFKKEVGARRVEYKKSLKFTAEISANISDAPVWIGIRKN